VVKVAIPLLLFNTFLEMKIAGMASILTSVGLVLGYALVFGLLPATFIFADTPEEMNGLLLSMSMGWNIGLFAFPIVKLLYGEADFEAMALFDIPNVMVNFGLSYAVVASCSPSSPMNSPSVTPTGYLPLEAGPAVKSGLLNRVSNLSLKHRKTIVQKISTFPPLLWGLLGLSLNIVGFRSSMIPSVIENTLKQVADTTTPTSMIAMGLLTNLSALRMDRMRMLWKLLVLRFLPSVLLILGILAFDAQSLKVTNFRVMLLGTIMPVPFIAIPYATDFGYDAAFASTAVVASTIVSFLLVVMHVLITVSL
jgi:hypothetical protein